MTESEEKILAKCLKLQTERPSTYKTRSMVKRHTRQVVFKRDGFKCLRCGETENLTIDHIVPLTMGGVKRRFNLQTLCDKCNFEKGDTIKSYKKQYQHSN